MLEMGRRSLFKKSGVLGLGVMAAGVARGVTTPPQTQGPFYPVRDRIDKDPDLTRLPGNATTARGDVVIVKGKVLDEAGKPLSGALVDVWQACETGRYDHPQDPNTQAALDPNFQYFARILTDNNGNYRFKTIIPGAYPATSDWERPPHIHFRVDAWGKQRLTTQMYFKGQPLNATDRILLDTEREFGRAARDSLIVDFQAGSDGIPVGEFNLVIGSTPSTKK